MVDQPSLDSKVKVPIEYVSDRGLLIEILTRLNRIEQKVIAMADAFSNLTSEVSEMEDATQSAIRVMDGIGEQLRAALLVNNGDPEAVKAEVQALADRLNAQQDQLAEAILRNTETKPDVLPPPPVEPEVEDTNSAPEGVDNGQQPGADTNSGTTTENLGDNAEDGAPASTPTL